MKVMYNGEVCNFHEDTKKYANLVKERTYNVTYLNQGSSSTTYRLEGVPGAFSSECFDLVGKYHAVAAKVPTVGNSFRCKVLVSPYLGKGFFMYDASVVESIFPIARYTYGVCTKNCEYILHVRKE